MQIRQTLSDKAWRENWRRNNRSALRAKYETDPVEAEAWDAVRFALRTAFGDEQLETIPLVAYQGTSKLD